MTTGTSAYAQRMADAARTCLLVAVASLPFSTAATNLFAALAFACWALSWQMGLTVRAVAAEPVAWLACALFASLAMGIAWSLVPAAEAALFLLKYRELLLFGIALFLFRDCGWRERLLGISFAAMLVLLALSFAVRFGLMQYADDRDFARTENAVLLRHAITHGFLMSLLSFGAAVFALRTAGWRRWVLASIAALAALNVWFAVQGRTGYVVMVVLALWLAYEKRHWRGLVVAAIAIAALLAAAWQWSPAFQSRVGQAIEETQDYRLSHDKGETSIGLRLHFWKRSAQWLSQHPLLGAGTGGWREAFYEATAGDAEYLHNRKHLHPHNEYVHLAVQLGPAGLALFVALLLAAFRRAGALPGEYATLARGLALAFAVGSLFNDLLLDTTEAHLWAILGGALFGASRTPPEPPRQA